MAKVVFEDYSFECKAAINNATIAWLHTWANEIASRAKRNCKMQTEGEEIGNQLAGSYKAVVDEQGGKAVIGSPMEAAYWEEFGTGEHADTVKNGGKQGRKGWWVYVKDNGLSTKVSNTYQSKEEAEAIAASMRADGFDAYATNGRDPNYTLQGAFDSVRKLAIADLEDTLKERIGE